jgi:hypothetical protein
VSRGKTPLFFVKSAEATENKKVGESIAKKSAQLIENKGPKMDIIRGDTKRVHI